MREMRWVSEMRWASERDELSEYLVTGMDVSSARRRSRRVVGPTLFSLASIRPAASDSFTWRGCVCVRLCFVCVCVELVFICNMDLEVLSCVYVCVCVFACVLRVCVCVDIRI
jgi:hypothetical protein